MKGKIFTTVFVSCAAVALTHAQVTVSLDDAHSAAVGVGTWNGDRTLYAGMISNNTGADLYVNGVGFTPTVGDWSGFNVTSGEAITSSLGSPIADGTEIIGSYLGQGLVDLQWTSGSGGLVAGHYEGTVNILGGADAGATDLLGSDTIAFDVLADPTFGGASMTMLTPDLTTVQGGSSTFQTQVAAGNLPFFAWPVYFFSGTELADSNIQFLNWPGLSGVLDPGTSWSGDSFRWVSQLSTPPGTHTSRYGYLGGVYAGDVNYALESTFTWHVEAVPEPATMAVLGIGLVGLASRRRRRR